MAGNFNLFQCGLSTIGAFGTVSRLSGNPIAGAAAAVGNVLTNTNCGLTGAGPGTYTSTATSANGAITTTTNYVGTPGQNSWTNITTQNPDGSSTGTTYNSDGTSSSTYTPPLPDLGSLGIDSISPSQDVATDPSLGPPDIGLTAGMDNFGAGGSSGGGGDDILMM